MNRFFTTALVAALLSPAISSAEDPSGEAFILQQRPGDNAESQGLSFRNNADAMLTIDALSVTAEDSNATWATIHDSVSKYVRTHPNKTIHIRFYHSDHDRTRPSIKMLHTKAKRILSDLRVFVVMIDETVRNDRKPWRDYREYALPSTGG